MYTRFLKWSYVTLWIGFNINDHRQTQAVIIPASRPLICWKDSGILQG